MKYKMLAMDMDDTLLMKDLTISECVKKRLKEAEELGVIIVLASGRVPFAMHKYIEELELDKQKGYAICANGAVVIATDTYEHVSEEFLETDFALEVQKEISRMGFPVQIYLEDTIYVTFDNEYTERDCQLTGLNKKIIDEDIHQFIRKHPISKFVIPASPDKVEAVIKELKSLYGDQAGIFTSKPYFLEIMPLNADKGYALKKLASELGVKRQEIIAVGDSHNDMGMIRYAGMGIAMNNSVEQLKNIADYVSEFTNEEDAIAKIIEKFIF